MSKPLMNPMLPDGYVTDLSNPFDLLEFAVSAANAWPLPFFHEDSPFHPDYWGLHTSTDSA